MDMQEKIKPGAKKKQRTCTKYFENDRTGNGTGLICLPVSLKQ